jgi:hypothetical protein
MDMTMINLPQVAGLVCALVSTGVGLAALGVDVLKSLHLQSLRTLLQYAAGICGVACLVHFFRSM